jgi:hypothetical protein
LSYNDGHGYQPDHYADPAPYNQPRHGTVDQVAAPMSFAGSGGRLLNLVRGRDMSPVAAAFAWTGVILGIMLAWTAILCWYLVFGLMVAPYRIMRRGQRRRKIDARRHDELMRELRRR